MAPKRHGAQLSSAESAAPKWPSPKQTGLILLGNWFLIYFWALDSLLCGPFLIFYLFWKAYEISYRLMYFLLCWLSIKT